MSDHTTFLSFRFVWLIVVVAAAQPARGLCQDSRGAHRPAVVEGEPAPDFTLKTLTGERVRLSDLRGKPVLVNFWASWCKPCATEMPLIVAAYDSLRVRGLAVLALNLTDQERLKDVRRFVEQFALPFPVLLDEKGRERKRFQLVTVPTSVFVDTAGVVRRVFSGPLTSEMLARGLSIILDVP